jgi:hypothetical protein
MGEEHSESWQEGFDAGYEWYVENSGSPIEQGFGFAIANKPHRFGDDEFNQGVEDGIEEARSR